MHDHEKEPIGHALHVLEILTSFEKSSREGKFIPLTTHYTRTAPMKNNPMHGILDD